VKQPSTSSLRDKGAQQAYRQQSRSQNKETQHVAHTYSLELARSVQSATPGRQAAALRPSLNDPSNMRMVSARTNQTDHRAIDKSLQVKAASGTPLTKREEARARQQVDFVQSCTTMPSGHRAAAQAHYKSLNTQSGRTLWDARKNRS
jgi:hypothetical protein